MNPNEFTAAPQSFVLRGDRLDLRVEGKWQPGSHPPKSCVSRPATVIRAHLGGGRYGGISYPSTLSAQDIDAEGADLQTQEMDCGAAHRMRSDPDLAKLNVCHDFCLALKWLPSASWTVVQNALGVPLYQRRTVRMYTDITVGEVPAVSITQGELAEHVRSSLQDHETRYNDYATSHRPELPKISGFGNIEVDSKLAFSWAGDRFNLGHLDVNVKWSVLVVSPVWRDNRRVRYSRVCQGVVEIRYDTRDNISRGWQPSLEMPRCNPARSPDDRIQCDLEADCH